MRYNPHTIEKKWRARWLKNGIYEPNLRSAKRPFYNLMMFPYPSAEGLHIGGVRTFTGVDIYGRYQRMRGYDVFEPMGLDGFGIHSENYALKIGKHPMKLAAVTEKNFYRQMREIGNGFSWKEKLETYDPNYYKWTQWIFVQMYKKGLAYRKKAKVNWCPSCQTVLADEQVVQGKCERCGTEVIKKDLEQWFFKITDYAGRLLKNLDALDWDPKVTTAQRNWIGKSEGAEIEFRIQNTEHSIRVFTTRPDTLFGATYMVLAPEHELVQKLRSHIQNLDEVGVYIKKALHSSEIERTAEGKEKTGVELKGVKAVNPANQEEIPVWIADYVLSGYGTGAIMAVPAHDERDFAFSKKFKLPIRCVIEPDNYLNLIENRVKQYEQDKNETREWKERLLSGETFYIDTGALINSNQFNGKQSEEAKWEITKFVGGKKKTQYRLRDWLISRQRYWGPPIPMIYCIKCGWNPVPEKDLPVRLPFVKNFRPTGTGRSPLASVKSFYETKCPVCKGEARRETDVSDTFLDSAWYFLRYPSVKEKKRAWDPATTKKWLPVHTYIGGIEHSVLHLLYSRFLAMVFHDWKLTDFEEPFARFVGHGLITKDGAKMSKSKGNVVSPDDYVKAYGADAVRMYLAFLAPLTEGGDFRDAGIAGITRFLDRVWKFYRQDSEFRIQNSALKRAVHRTIKKVGEDIEAFRYNTAISALMMLLNEFEHAPASVSKEDKKIFLQLLAPFAPHLAEELWPGLGGKFSIHTSQWPRWDETLIREESFELVVQVNGRVRGRMSLPRGSSQREAEQAAKNIPEVLKHLEKAPQKVIFVPDRLINFVV